MSDRAARADPAPEEIAGWLDRQAAECDLDRAEFLRALADAVEADGEPASRVAALETEVDEKVTDVRERVLQVKREADEKAEADHDHPELRDGVDSATAAIDELEDGLKGLRDHVATVESRVDEGFENYEEVLDYLTDATSSLDGKTQTLATALLDVRDTVEHLAATRDGILAEITREANRHGVRRADCEECGATVDVALLRAASCPHCGVAFSGVEPAGRPWFLGSHTLLAGDPPPALEGGEADLEDTGGDVAAIAGEEGQR